VLFGGKRDAEFEAAFSNDFFEKSLIPIRVSIVMAFFLYAGFGFLDIWAAPESKKLLWIIRFGIVCPLVAVTFFITYSNLFKRHSQIILAMVSLVVGMGIVAMIAIINRGQPAFAHYYSGLILVTMWNYTLLRLRFLYATITTLFLVLAYEITAVVFQGILAGGMAGEDFPAFLINNFFLLSVLVISILIGYTIETYMRTDFQQRQDIRKAYKDLKQSQAQLVQAEKEASLGQLVAGVAHEINTPVGIGVTAASHFAEITKDITKAFEHRTATKQDMEKYFRVVQQDSELIIMNLIRTSELVKSFKMVAADQTSGERREFNVKSYIEDIILSLRPKLKKTSVQVSVTCPENLVMDSYPGALAQIFTNFVINSLMHAYELEAQGQISINVERDGDSAVFTYRDDGKGIPKENLNKIFDPFFTTSRGSGGTGLGLSVVSNLVTKTLRGHLHCDSVQGCGVTFIIKAPLAIRARDRADSLQEELK